MAKFTHNTAQSFSEMKERLDDLALQVKSKDLSLEESLDLFDEAVQLGSAIVDLVDKTEFSPQELEVLAQKTEDQESDHLPESSNSTE